MVRSYMTVLGAALLAGALAMDAAYAASPSFPPADGGRTIQRERTISCSDGQRLLLRQGFRQIRALDCRGLYFVYRAQRDGERYEIALDGRNGRIVDQRRVR